MFFFIKAYGLGNNIHTIHIERWFGTLECCLACCRRRSRCLSRSREKQKIWIFADLYNWAIPHQSLKLGKEQKTLAMAAGLVGYPISYADYVSMPVYDDYKFRGKVAEKVKAMNDSKMLGASQRVKAKPEKLIVMQLEEAAA